MRCRVASGDGRSRAARRHWQWHSVCERLVLKPPYAHRSFQIQSHISETLKEKVVASSHASRLVRSVSPLTEPHRNNEATHTQRTPIHTKSTAHQSALAPTRAPVTRAPITRAPVWCVRGGMVTGVLVSKAVCPNEKLARLFSSVSVRLARALGHTSLLAPCCHRVRWKGLD